MTTPHASHNVHQTSSNWKQVTLGELLLWMAATAAVLGHEQWRLRTATVGSDDVFRSYFNGRLLFYAPLDGACLAGLVLCLWRRHLRHPGHWLLVLFGTGYVLCAAQGIANFFLGEDRLDALPVWGSFLYGRSVAILLAAEALLATYEFRRERLWAATFAAKAAESLVDILHTLLVFSFKGNRWFLDEFAWSLGFRILYSSTAVVAICAVLIDGQRSQRDLLHWVGITVLLLFVVAEWPTWFVWLRLFR